jgi:elongation factor Ts
MSDAKLIMQLRKATGAGMIDCKKALEEAGGDYEAAIDLLRKRGAAKAAKKADRATSEGAARVAQSEGKAAVVAILCETDFVAKNDDFVAAVDSLAADSLATDTAELFEANKNDLVLKMGENIQLGEYAVVTGDVTGAYTHSNNKVAAVIAVNGNVSAETLNDIAMHIAAMRPSYLDADSVPAEVIDREKGVYVEQLQNEGKPAEIIEKILVGKMAKFYEENCLVNQKFIKDEDKTIADLVEGAEITGFKLITV